MKRTIAAKIEAETIVSIVKKVSVTIASVLGTGLALAAVMAAAKGTEAQNASVVETLPRADYERGWIRLFDGATTFGWRERGRQTWKVADGALISVGDRPERTSKEEADAQARNEPERKNLDALVSSTEFGDFDIRGECEVESNAVLLMTLHAPADTGTPGKSAIPITFSLPQTEIPHGTITRMMRAKNRVKFTIRIEGDKVITLDASGKPVTQLRRIRPGGRGIISLQSIGLGAVKMYSLDLRPLGQTPLFNGKDLTGWKAVEGHASVFGVNSDGNLSVHNGNGDLQTTSMWGDFALQLDVFSNGDHLNSGAFFRVEPGVFWGGYEAQIRSQWEGGDRSKPVDIGTGGIYNIQPARKVVSSDREWFTMTVIATGIHLGVWVNGYQTADVIDTRPADETNARNGARTRAGVFGLQGHDPTTDLAFRNIRAVELPSLKSKTDIKSPK